MDAARAQMDEVLGVYDTLMRLGYPQDDMGVQVGSDSVYVFVLCFGTRYLIRIGERYPNVDYDAAWREAREGWNASSQESRQKLIDAFEAKGRHVDVLAGLCTNGLYPIGKQNERARATGGRK